MTQYQHITHYSILTDTHPQELERAVEEAIHAGWQPHGALTVSGGDSSPLYAQAMVKYAERFR